MLKRITPVLFAAVIASVPVGAQIIEQVLVNVNGDILTKTEFEQRQVSVLRTRPELANVTPESPELQKGDRRSDAAAHSRRRR